MINKLKTRLLLPFISDSAIKGKSLKHIKKRHRKKKALLKFTKELSKVTITSKDGFKLYGYYKEVSNPQRFIIAVHGWRSTGADDFKYQHELFEKSGCNVLYIDQRCHGKSKGKYIGFGALERYDVLLWAQYAVKNLSNGLPVYLFGVSMGATSVMMASALELPIDVKGIIADCGFTSPIDIWMDATKSIKWLDRKLFYKLANKRCIRLAGYDATKYSTLKSLKNTDKPVLFIHGDADTFVPMDMTIQSYEACVSPKKLFIAKNATHAKSCYIENELYEKTLLEFYEFCENITGGTQI